MPAALSAHYDIAPLALIVLMMAPTRLAVR